MIVVIYSDMLYKRTWSNISMFSMTLYQIKFLKFYNAKCYLLEMLGMESKRGFALFLDFCGFFWLILLRKITSSSLVLKFVVKKSNLGKISKSLL